MMKQFALPIAVTLCAIVIGSYVQGRLVDRWVPNRSEELKRFEDRIKQVPMVIGDWDGTDTEEDTRSYKVAKITGSLSRVYRNRRTGEVVSVFMACGKSVNIADHTPDQCVVAAGFSMLSLPNPYRIDIQPEPANFYYSVFHKEEPDRTINQLIFWTWHAPEGFWQAPDWPVLAFTTAPALFKMYIISELGKESSALEESANVHFAREALPIMEKALFPPSPVSEVGEQRQPDEGGDS